MGQNVWHISGRRAYRITKPLNSWNPLWANLQHFIDMADLLKQVPSWKDKIKILLMPPDGVLII